MNTLAAATMYADKMEFGALAAWLVTGVLLIAGYQKIKEVIALVLMKLYEFFIQRNAIKL